jgi:cytochrome c553
MGIVTHSCSPMTCENDMFLVKNIIAAGLSLISLFIVTVAYAEGGDPTDRRQQPMVIEIATVAGNPIAGREKSQLCQGCHGEFGISTTSLIPKLAGQYSQYIEKQVRNYWAGTRSHQIMNAAAATVSEADLPDVAAYFAHQHRMEGDGSAGNPVGKNIFLRGDASRMILACVNCHGIKGKGLDPNISMFPVIGGQHSDYIRKQLLDFRAGYRTNSPNGIMNTIAKHLTDSEIEALADYVSKQ